MKLSPGTLAMPLISCFILALLVESVVGQDETTTDKGPDTTSTFNQVISNGSTFSTTVMADNSTSVPILNSTSDMNITGINSTATPSLNVTGDETPTESDATDPMTPTEQTTTPKPIAVSDLKKPATAGRNVDGSTTVKPNTAGSDSTGIIILVVIILVAAAFAGACYVARRRGRRYSVDFTSRPDETNIPLSAVEPEAPADTLPFNGVQTFETAETSANEQQEPEEKPEAQEEQKAESDKSVVDPPAESAAPLPDGKPDEPKAGVAEQQESPPDPVETNIEDKTDDESTVSNKTSVESLKETNENNSNSAEFSLRRDLKMRDIVWEVPLKCPA